MTSDMHSTNTEAPVADGAQAHASASRPAPDQLDVSNLSPGAARRFEKLLDSIDRFTSAVETKSLRLPQGR